MKLLTNPGTPKLTAALSGCLQMITTLGLSSQRSTMRFLQIRSEAAQTAAVVFRARDLLVLTQVMNALRGHPAEFGLVITKGLAHAAGHPTNAAAAARWVMYHL